MCGSLCVQSVGGGFFSRSSRNIQYKDETLSAFCQTSGGNWSSATLDLNYHLENIDGIVRVTTAPPGNFLASCDNVALEGTSMLNGSARRKNSSVVTFQLQLDDYVANVEGKLEIGGGFFSRTSSQISFTGDGWLEALCKTTSKEIVPSSLNLNFYLENINGVLRFADSPPGNFMATARNVTLDTSTTKLSGSLERVDSSWQNFELNLDYNVQNVEGKLMWLLNPHVPYYADENERGGSGSHDASDAQLVEYAASILPHGLVLRVQQITPPANQKEKNEIASIIAKWDLDLMDRGWGQSTLVEFPKELPGWRIDNQENGSFPVDGLQYYNIAVQKGRNVYSSVLVPVGYNLGKSRFRHAMLLSRDNGRVYRIAPPKATDPRQPPPQFDPSSSQSWVASLNWEYKQLQ
ncbi:hypothetical protein KP509_04G063400 [Ceratopteris richardii]|uniref:Cyanovirin-N domain-containing protein n=1 Tax=Ceratopteris richardii TaxID=49495 RepID=A0A8T2V130_CERRI|nr:hypothetical protein KP509_04G063300 [Ceratopteris richardii]KAH7439474.1 hypothetical protein KP509_04G063400 [Ceratopteris richardii]